MATRSSDSESQTTGQAIAGVVSRFGKVVRTHVQEAAQQAREEIRQGLADLREDLDDELASSESEQRSEASSGEDGEQQRDSDRHVRAPAADEPDSSKP